MTCGGELACKSQHVRTVSISLGIMPQLTNSHLDEKDVDTMSWPPRMKLSDTGCAGYAMKSLAMALVNTESLGYSQ